MQSAFESATPTGIATWATNNVTNMNYMFRSSPVSVDIATSGNVWNVSNVTSMTSMFQSSTGFASQDLSSWDVTSLQAANDMFRSSNFNGDVSNWTLTSATTFAAMFKSCSNFTGTGLDSWTLPSDGAINLTFQGMFQQMNQNITTIGGWNTTRVTSMAFMFDRNAAFDTDIGSWDVSGVNNMTQMFKGATSFNKNIGNWTINSSADIKNMFDGATAFAQPIRGWTQPANVTDMFNGATDMASAFSTATGYAATPTTGFFSPATMTLTWSSVSDSEEVTLPFSNMTGVDSVNTMVTWSVTTSGVTTTDTITALTASGGGAGVCTNTKSAPGTGGPHTITAVVYLAPSASNGRVGRIQSSSAGVSKAKLTSVAVSDDASSSTSWGMGFTDSTTSAVGTTPALTSLQSAFNGCSTLTSVPSYLPVTVTTLESAFLTATSFTSGIVNWLPSGATGVTNLNSVVSDCTNFNENLSNWDTSGVNNMNRLFKSTGSFNNGGDAGIGSWDVSQVTDMRQMFFFATLFDQNLRKWNTSSTTATSAFGGSNGYSDMFTSATAMLSTYNGVTGFGATPTAAFFNQFLTITWTGINDGETLSIPLSGLTGTPVAGTDTITWTGQAAATITNNPSYTYSGGGSNQTITATIMVSTSGVYFHYIRRNVGNSIQSIKYCCWRCNR